MTKPDQPKAPKTYAERLGTPVTLATLSAVLDLVEDACLATASYMVADWGTPDETGKQKAIDEMLAKTKALVQLRRELLGLENGDDSR